MDKKEINILIVDDDEYFCETITYLLEKKNYKVDKIHSASQVTEKLQAARYDLVLLDLRIGEDSGLDVLPQIKTYDPNIVVIMITEVDSASIAVEAIKKGAYDYLTKSIDDNELSLKISRAIDKHDDLVEIKALKDSLSERFGLGNIIGKNAKMQEIYAIIKKVCNTDVTVLVCGETGSGKELVAKAIHFNSQRRDKPFIAVNCAAISENLMESEIFGHEKGAFTGAHAQKKGKVELAHTGALFLDEIGDMSTNLQAKLLRFLQDKSFERVGGTTKMDSDVRVIAATNRNLPEMIKEGKFREDLFYRLNAVQIMVPPLRERFDDLELLVDTFIKRSNVKYNRNIQAMPPEILRKMNEYPWPGNIREMENFVDRLVLLCEDDNISFEQATVYLASQKHSPTEPTIDLSKSLKDAREEFEQNYLIGLLTQYYGNIKLVSEKAGVDRRIIYEKMKKYGFTKEDFKAGTG